MIDLFWFEIAVQGSLASVKCNIVARVLLVHELSCGLSIACSIPSVRHKDVQAAAGQKPQRRRQIDDESHIFHKATFAFFLLKRKIFSNDK